MAKNKLSREDLDELRERVKVFNAQKLICAAIELHNKVWIDKKIQEKGFSPGAFYELNMKTGHFIEKTKAEEKEYLEDKKNKENG